MSIYDFKIQELDKIFSDGHYLIESVLGLGFNAQIGNTNIKTQTNQALNAKHQNWNARFIEQFNTNLCKTKMEEIYTYLNKIKLQPNQDKINLATAQITQLRESAENVYTSYYMPILQRDTKQTMVRHSMCKG